MNDRRIDSGQGYDRQIVPVQAARTITRPAAELIFLLLVPVLAFWAFNLSAVNQAGRIDPYVYTGYIHNFRDLLQRYGLTYYSVRFGLILPAQAFSFALGPELGYLAFRYALMLVAGIPLYSLVKQRLNTSVAVLTYCALSTSPLLARSLLWDHPDSAAVPYLLAAICFVALELSPRPAWDLLAGVLFGLALNSNFFVVSQMGIFAVVCFGLMIVYTGSARRVVLRFLPLIVGVLLVCLSGALYFRHLIGLWDIFSPTIDIVTWLSRGGMQNWRLPGVSWIADFPHVLLLPILTLYCLLATGLRRKPFFQAVMTAYMGGTFVFYYTYQFALNANSLQLFYYFAYSLPAVFLSLPVLFHNLWEAIPDDQATSMAAIGVAGFTLPWLLKSRGLDLFAGFHLLGVVALAALTAGFVVLAVHIPLRRPLRLLAVAVATLLIAVTFDAGLSGHTYSSLVRRHDLRDHTERDVYRVTMQFIGAVPRLAQTPGDIRFWYSNRPGNLITSVQSTYLWGYSRFQQQPPADPGMPYIGPFQLAVLRDQRVRYLGLIGESSDELEAGLRAFSESAISVAYTPLERRILKSGGYQIHWQLIRLERQRVRPQAGPDGKT